MQLYDYICTFADEVGTIAVTVVCMLRPLSAAGLLGVVPTAEHRCNYILLQPLFAVSGHFHVPLSYVRPLQRLPSAVFTFCLRQS